MDTAEIARSIGGLEMASKLHAKNISSQMDRLDKKMDSHDHKLDRQAEKIEHVENGQIKMKRDWKWVTGLAGIVGGLIGKFINLGDLFK